MNIKNNYESKQKLIDSGFKRGNLDFQFYKGRLLICLEPDGYRCYYVSKGWDTDLAGNKYKDDFEIWDEEDNVCTIFDKKTFAQLEQLFFVLMDEPLIAE